MYGDNKDNIGWWASAKLLKRPDHVNSKMILDGASGKDEPLGYFPFTENPQSENPPSGYVYSANNQPDSVNGYLYPGYYIVDDRATSIVNYLHMDKKWDIQEMKTISTDNSSVNALELAKYLFSLVEGSAGQNQIREEALAVLVSWNGNCTEQSVAPTIYYKWVFHILKNTFEDELGEKDFQAFLTLHLTKKTHYTLPYNEKSIWWDDMNTPNTKETRNGIVERALETSLKELTAQFGERVEDWQWGKAHTLEHTHLLGRQKPLDKFFNVGPFPMSGANETINNQGFILNGEGKYKIVYGPAMRILLDFADVENSISVLPTGQSGNVMSPHYYDQAEMFNTGNFRKQMMNKDEIVKNAKGTVIFTCGGRMKPKAKLISTLEHDEKETNRIFS